MTKGSLPTTDRVASGGGSLPAGMLSKHFSLRELTASGTAIRHNIDNSAPDDVVERLRLLCENVLEPLRRRFGVLRVTSGYRCARLNALVGGATTSQHLSGEAADIHVASAAEAVKMVAWARANIVFDQLISEYRRKSGTRWLHLSYSAKGANRREVFSIFK